MNVIIKSVYRIQPKASIIIPIQQKIRIFDIFFESLINTIGKNIEIIFVIDGKHEEILSSITSSKNRINATGNPFCIASSDTTIGWAKCVNWGIKNRNGKHIIIADSDTILSGNWSDHILSHFFPESNIGAVGAVLLYPQTGGIQHCGITFSEDNIRHLYLNGLQRNLPETHFPVQCIASALCAISEETLNRTGMIDEGFFNSYGDLDFFIRVKSSGLEVIVDPRVIGYHWERSAGTHRTFSRKGNLGRFWRKWANQIKPDLWNFLEKSINKFKENNGPFTCNYIGIDLTAARSDAESFWSSATDYGINISGILDHSAEIVANEKIAIFEYIDHKNLNNKSPFLFLVDNFSSLSENHYWWSLRKPIQKKDLIIDLYANVISFEEIADTCWPGRKIR